MSPLESLVYSTLLTLIRAYKRVELQVLKLFTPLLVRKAKQIGERIGVVLHCPGDKEWTKGDADRVLSRCKYEKLLHVKINRNTFFARIANGGSLAFGETYMEGLWEPMESEHEMVLLCSRVLENNLMDLYWTKWNRLLEWVQLCAFNLQGSTEAFEVGKVHYDLGNDLYEIMLDPWLQYTCGYWKDTNNLNEAQINKMKLIAEKLDLKPGMKVLDIGCGWGLLCKYLAENYGVNCVGITISEEGVKYGRKVNKGFPVEIRLQDYREVNEKFDRIVSVGMFEHVGFRNYQEFFKMTHRCLKEDGIFLLHTIGRNHANIPRSELFLHKYIFPNGNLPNPQDLCNSTHGLFIIEDWHNFGLDYSKTLEAWRCNFLSKWEKIEPKYGENFKRMWVYYLSFCAGMFLSRRLHVYQLLLSKDGLKREIRAPR